MSGCIYRTAEGKCELYSDYGKGIVSYCDFYDCEDKRPSNADKLRSLSDEDLAKWIDVHEALAWCPVEMDEEVDPVTRECLHNDFCWQCILEWLQREVDE